MDLRVEDISETIKKEIRSNTVEIKGSINKIKNMLDGMNSKLEEKRNELMT